jgi:zinc ribbon protein
MNCPKCGTQNRDSATFCSSCGSGLQAGASGTTSAPPPYPTMRTNEPPSAHSAKKYAQGRNSFIATMVSFVFPAGGQLYNGDTKKAGAIWLGYLGCFFLSSTGIGVFPAFFISLGIWAFAIFDAHQVAKRLKPLW